MKPFLAISFLLALPAFAQTFDVISVKPFKGAPPGFQGIQPGCKGGHFAAVTPVFLTMEWAYNTNPMQDDEFRAKLPIWAQSISGSYELQATTRPDVTESECRKMAQHLFEERFHFKYHMETVTEKVYEMVIGKGGLKMKPADDSPGWSITLNGFEAKSLPGTPVRHGITMDDLANFISGADLDHTPVVNKTGLEGMYKFKIAFSRGAGANLNFADPDIFTAVEQQLGLKLQDSRGPVQHYVIESIDKPDEN